MCQDGPNLVAKVALVEVFTATEQLETKDLNLPAHVKQHGDEVTIIQGNILTFADDKFSPVDAISIKGDTILSVGSLADVQRVAGSTTPVRVLDEGQALVPGFVDPHLHLLFTALVSDHESILNFSPSVVRTIDSLDFSLKFICFRLVSELAGL
jgi:hypothetical protein